MSYWLFYFIAVFFLSHIVASSRKKNYIFIFILVTTFLVTPSQIELKGSDYAPSLFAFIFNVLFERDFSTRVLRPLAFSIPLSLIFYLVLTKIKKRFFL